MTTTTSDRDSVVDTITDSIQTVNQGVRSWLLAHRADIAWVTPVLLVAAVVAFVNITGSPQRIDDEGTYTAQAWAVANLGELAHYTYWYDHPPLGWLQIAGYAQLTGAFARWDIAVLAGREASVVFSLIAALLLFMLARRTGLSRPAAAAAAVLFSLSPLAVQFHRTVYLDNIAMPWLLLAFLLASERRHQLVAFAGSAMAFGLAVLSKETFLLTLPFLVWVMLRSAHRETRRYTLSVAASLLALIGGSYLLLAIVKGELLSSVGRVSLMDGILFQLSSREGSGSLLDPESLINRTLGMWWQLDPAFIVLSLLAAGVAVFRRSLRPHAIMVLALTAFMFRPGGYLPVPYVIVLIPFGALLIAGVTDAAIRRLREPRAGTGDVTGTPGRGRKGRVAAVATVAVAVAGTLAIAPLWFVQLRGFVLADLDKPMRDAQWWLSANVDRDERLIVDDAMWVDLVEDGWDRDNVVWYYKLDTDPAVQSLSPNGWQDSDYIVTTDSMRTFPSAFPQVSQALENSVTVASFGEGNQQVEVRRIDVGGAANAAAAADQAAISRTELGAQLIQNASVSLADPDTDLVSGGRVDARILALVGSLAADGSVDVAGFPAVAGEDGRALRQVALTAFSGADAVVDGRLTPDAERTLENLRGVFAPDAVVVDGDSVVLRYPVVLGQVGS